MALAATILPVATARVSAQNLPPPGAYQPIPNFVGVGAGLQFREAINDRFSGAQPIAPSIASTALANLPPEQDGMLLFCNNCKSATPCVSGGGGAFAFGQGGTWSCGGAAAAWPASLTQNLLTGGYAIDGSTSSGGDQINFISVNGVLNATGFGAVCSDTTASATTTASNATVTVSAIGDFQVGQYVKLDAAGASNTISTPTISSVTDDGYLYSNLPDPATLDFPVFGSTVTANGNCTADAGTANHSNASCTTTYCYSVQNVGQTGIGAGLNGMRSAASAAVCDTTGPATLSIGNAILVTYSVDANTAGTIIRRCTGASCTPASIYAVIPNPPGGSASSAQYRDNGLPYGIDEEAGTTAVAADLNAQITTIAGTSVTLSVAPSQSGAKTMRHDNAPALQHAVNASIASGTNHGSKVYLPACATHYHMAQAVSLWGLAQTGIAGASTNSDAGTSNTQIVWDGSPGGVVFNLNYATDDTIENIGVEGLTGSTPGILIDEDSYGTSSPSTQGPGAPASNAATYSTPTKLSVRHVECGVVGLCVDLGGSVNDENAVIDDLNCSAPNYPTGGNICVYSNSQETYNEAFYNTGCTGRDYCFDFVKAGSFVMLNTNSEVSGIIYNLGTISDQGRAEGGQEEGAQFFQYNGANGMLTFSDWRLSGGGGPWAAIVYTGSGSPVYLNNYFEPPSATTSGNVVSYGGKPVFINDYWNYELSFLGITGEWTPGGGAAASPYLIPITNQNGSAIPQFTCIQCGVYGQTVPGIVSNEPNQATAFNSAPAATTLTGTSGSAVCSQSMQGTLKIASCYLNGYAETGTAQTFAYPTAFSTTPVLLESGGSCGTYNPSSTASTLTLPANASMTAETCNITAIGQ